MTKTLEIIRNDVESQKDFDIISPDHQEPFYANGYTIDVDAEVLHEDGVTRVDISNNKYFHIWVEHTGHLKISAGENKQKSVKRKEKFKFPYTDKYILGEKIEEVDIPDTSEARSNFRFMPSLKLEVEWDKVSDEVEPTGVDIDGTMYNLEER